MTHTDPLQTPGRPNGVQMAALTHVARHLLRFMDKAGTASTRTMRREVGRESDVIPALGILLRHGLIEATQHSHHITPAGRACVRTERLASKGAAPKPAASAPLLKALPRTTCGVGTYQGAELQHRSAHTR